MAENSESQEQDQQEQIQPLKTSDVYHTKNLPARFDNPEWFEGYNTKPKSPFYATTSQSYGATPPSVHTMPKAFHGKSQKFTGYYGKFGMYRNHSLNTEVDKTIV
ncbi:piercer of microtubule wall 1 protein-like [Dysidea avara]|uniref:piercer of microtubule wall 1 protein-like n=1 Tax=Dysidea avara TaxID=196820 RepID=UPI00332C50D6